MQKVLNFITAIFLLLSLTFSSAVSSALAEEEAMTIKIKRLTLSTALAIAQAAITQCRKDSVQISKQKAHTAMVFNSPLSALEDRFTKPYQVAKLDGLIISAGGIPINIGGAILGGIGVSGAPSGKTDENCARIGLEVVSDDLEMESM